MEIKKKGRLSRLSMTFVSNDDVMEHILEEVSEIKSCRDRVQTLSKAPTVSTPERSMQSSRKAVNYCETQAPQQDQGSESDDDSDRDTSSSEDDAEDQRDQQPKVLLDREGPLGNEVYSFKMPKRAGKMALMAAQSVDRSQTHKTAVKRGRCRLKKKIGREGEDSDFSPDESSDEDDDEGHEWEDARDDLNSDTSSERSMMIKRPKQTPAGRGRGRGRGWGTAVAATPGKTTRKRSAAIATASNKNEASAKAGGSVWRSSRQRTRCDEAVLPNVAEEYFEAHSGQALTSDHTLSQLETPQMTSGQQAKALENAPNSYASELRELFEEHCSLFNKWMYHLSYDFNILLYGLGSKRGLLDEFRQQMLQDYTHIVVNGYFPSLTIKNILNSISDDVISAECTNRNMADQLDFIEEHLEEMDEPLFLIIHNLDGSMIRGAKIQTVLSRLAQISNVHILASMDHINAPLVWDQERASSFRWLLYDVTTFLPYLDETSYENSLLVQQSGMLALSSLTHVLRSLTPNARGIFNMLVEYQLEHSEEGSYNGMSFQDLYQRCREAFLVNSDLTLRAQLTEFRDHKLILSRKSLDGMELLSILLDNSTLTKFKEL